MKIWVDGVKQAPYGFIWAKSVDEARRSILMHEFMFAVWKKPYYIVDVIDVGHDSGEYQSNGGDCIKLLEWLEETGRNCPIHIHSMDSTDIKNMHAIIQRNGWTEVMN